jgi:hypothetical protein
MMKKKYATPYKWAKLAGLTTQAVYARLKAGTLETVRREDLNGEVRRVIDLAKFPPERARDRE